MIARTFLVFILCVVSSAVSLAEGDAAIKVELTSEQYQEELRVRKILSSGEKDHKGDPLFMQLELSELSPIWRAAVARKQIWWCGINGYWDQFLEIENYFMSIEQNQRSEYDVIALDRIAKIYVRGADFQPPRELGLTDRESINAWKQANVFNREKNDFLKNFIVSHYPPNYYLAFNIKCSMITDPWANVSQIDPNEKIANWEGRFDQLQRDWENVYALPELKYPGGGEDQIGWRIPPEIVLSKSQGTLRYYQESAVRHIYDLLQAEAGKMIATRDPEFIYEDPLLLENQEKRRQAFNDQSRALLARRPDFKTFFDEFERAELRQNKERFEHVLEVLDQPTSAPMAQDEREALKRKYQDALQYVNERFEHANP